MLQYFHDPNAYVEETQTYTDAEGTNQYFSDYFLLKLDEVTNRVTLYPMDGSNVPFRQPDPSEDLNAYNALLADHNATVLASATAIAGARPLADQTFSNFTDALAFYQSLAAQLAEGDVIRHDDNAAITLRQVTAEDNSRYPSF